MSRLIEHERKTPYEIAEGTELPVYICACGLSKNKPFCDGSHKRTRDEEDSALYAYDGNSRIKVEKQY
jgi:CDGSH-type Zn-finger protein